MGCRVSVIIHSIPLFSGLILQREESIQAIQVQFSSGILCSAPVKHRKVVYVYSELDFNPNLIFSMIEWIPVISNTGIGNLLKMLLLDPVFKYLYELLLQPES